MCFYTFFYVVPLSGSQETQFLAECRGGAFAKSEPIKSKTIVLRLIHAKRRQCQRHTGRKQGLLSNGLFSQSSAPHLSKGIIPFTLNPYLEVKNNRKDFTPFSVLEIII